MTLTDEQEARGWIAETFSVPRETIDRLAAFGELLRRESERQNLVSKSTLDYLWVRHIADSAQLLLHRPDPHSSWLDVGTGAGFPGLIISVLHEGPVTLVEPRRLRTEFLARAAELLNIQPRIVTAKVDRLGPEQFDVITARALANAPQTLSLCQLFSTEKTRFILPKGRTAKEELDQTRSTWQGEFRLEPSLTDPDARIIVAEGVRPRTHPKRIKP